MTPNSTALITVAYNSSEDLRSHWSGVDLNEISWIVVDNNSSDNSAEVARELGAKVLKVDENLGFSAGNNLAADGLDVDCLIFVNPDVEIVPSDVYELASKALELDAIIAPQLLNSDGTLQENGRRAPYLYRQLQHFLGRASSTQSYEVTAHEGEIKQVSWATGAVLAVPRTIFESVGGWDSHYFIYYEDCDICLRARNKGHQVYLDGGFRWKHAWKRASHRSLSFRFLSLQLRSATRFYAHYPRLLLHPRLLKNPPNYLKDEN